MTKKAGTNYSEELIVQSQYPLETYKINNSWKTQIIIWYFFLNLTGRDCLAISSAFHQLSRLAHDHGWAM